MTIFDNVVVIDAAAAAASVSKRLSLRTCSLTPLDALLPDLYDLPRAESTPCPSLVQALQPAGLQSVASCRLLK